MNEFIEHKSSRRATFRTVVAVAEKLLDTIMEGPGCYRCHDRATLEHKETNTAQAIGLRDFALGDFALVRKQRFLQVHINMIG